VKLDDGPSARGRFAAAVDEERGWFITHGGRFRDDSDSGGHHGTSSDYTLYDDVWAYDLNADTWTQLSESGGPDARVSHVAVVWDGKLIIHGGNSSVSGAYYTALGDLWAFDLETLEWSELDASGGPSDRLFHGGAVSSDGMLYVYAGGDEQAFTGPFLDDLWALDLTTLTWTELHSGGSSAPEGRLSPSLVVDEANNRLVTFGGHDDGILGNNNQVWAYDLSSGDWSQLHDGDVYANSASGTCDFPSDFTDPDYDSPERRYTQASALTDSGEMLVFGGKTDCGVIDDVWSYDLADDTWSEQYSANSGEICLRAFAECESLCF
jgi:N-acetylneuraminic acid mutarotase